MKEKETRGHGARLQSAAADCGGQDAGNCKLFKPSCDHGKISDRCLYSIEMKKSFLCTHPEHRLRCEVEKTGAKGQGIEVKQMKLDTES